MEVITIKSDSEPLSQSKIAEFKRIIIDADGKPILLKNSPYPNIDLYLAVSSSTYTPLERDKSIITGTNIEDRQKGLIGSRCIVSTGVFAKKIDVKDEAGLLPIGFCNFQIIKEDMVEEGAGDLLSFREVSKLISAKGKLFQDAYTHWGRKNISFEVDIDYQKHGIGSLMLATSMIMLNHYGAKRLNHFHLLEPAEKTWKKFGAIEKYVGIYQNGRSAMGVNTEDVSVQSIISSSHTEKIISKFI